MDTACRVEPVTERRVHFMRQKAAPVVEDTYISALRGLNK